MVEILMFELSGQRFGVPLAAVREVFNLGALTPVPTAPGAVAGVTNLRGQVVPVLDLALLLEVGLHRLRLGDPAIVVEIEGARAALLGERVVGIGRQPRDAAAGAVTLLETEALFARVTATMAAPRPAAPGGTPC
jgi:chemotaxis signal transduction protein